MARESVMSTPIFDQLLREMAQRAEPRAKTPQAPPAEPATAAAAAGAAGADQAQANAARRRHRAD